MQITLIETSALVIKHTQKATDAYKKHTDITGHRPGGLQLVRTKEYTVSLLLKNNVYIYILIVYTLLYSTLLYSTLLYSQGTWGGKTAGAKKKHTEINRARTGRGGRQLVQNKEQTDSHLLKVKYVCIYKWRESMRRQNSWRKEKAHRS